MITFNFEEEVTYLQKVINTYKITSMTNFSHFRSCYREAICFNLVKHLKFYDRYKAEKENKTLLESLKTLSDFQKLILENKIGSSASLRKFCERVYRKMCDLKLKDQVVYYSGEDQYVALDSLCKFHFTREISDYYKTLEDFQSLADQYLSEKYFKRYHGVIYRKYLELKEKGIIKGELVFPDFKRTYYGDTYKTPEEFQKYIDDNNIQSPTEFENSSKSLYKRLVDSGFADKVTYPVKKKVAKIKNSRDKYKTLENIQDFVIENKIINIQEFREVSDTLYRYYLVLREKEGRDIVFAKLNLISSLEEWNALKELIKLDIKFKIKYRFKGSKFEFDFLVILPTRTFILETHGGQHFSEDSRPEFWYNRDEIENDKKKFKLAKKNGIEVYYVTYGKAAWKVYEENKYFQPVYHSVSELLKQLGYEAHENPNYEKDLSNLFVGNFLDTINKICQSFEIKNESELENFEYIYLMSKELNLLDKIKYCCL
jgi:hypothetical protein